MSNNINWKEIRAKEFPVLETMPFLDAACVSFAPHWLQKTPCSYIEPHLSHLILFSFPQNSAYSLLFKNCFIAES